MMKMMNSVKPLSVAMAAVFLVAACGNDDAVQAAAAPDKPTANAPSKPQRPIDEERVSHTVKPTMPFRLDYEVVGTPIVGNPVTVRLGVESVVDVSSVQLNYGSRDVSALMLAESQPASVMLEGAATEGVMRQQVTIVPQREGRHYLNVRVSMMTPTGQNGTTMAIPIQVGEGARELIGQDRITTTSDGERVRRNPGN